MLTTSHAVHAVVSVRLRARAGGGGRAARMQCVRAAVRARRFSYILSPSLSSGTRAHARACGLLGIPTRKFDRDHNLVRHFRVAYIKIHRSIEFSLQSGRA